MSQTKRWASHTSGTLDAGVSSIGNLGISIAAARSLSLPAFGLVSISLLTGIILVGFSRALYGDPLTLTYSAASDDERHLAAGKAISAALSGALLFFPVLALLLSVIVVVSGGDSSTAIWLGLSLAAVSPALVAQELLRAVAYSGGRPLTAFLNSLSWTVTLIASLVACHLAHVNLSESGYVVVWGASALAGAAVGMILNRAVPRLGGLKTWYASHAQLSKKLLMDFALTEVTAEGAFVVMSMVAGATQAGLLRKALVPLAPIGILTSGIVVITQPALVRRVAAGNKVREVRNLAYQLGAAAAGAAVMLGIVVAFLPERLMRQIVGQDWATARPLVPLLALYLGLGAVAACQGVALRALDRLAEQVRLRLFLTPVTLMLVCVTATAGARGAAIGLCISLILVVAGWAWLLVRRRPLRSRGTWTNEESSESHPGNPAYQTRRHAAGRI